MQFVYIVESGTGDKPIGVMARVIVSALVPHQKSNFSYLAFI